MSKGKQHEAEASEGARRATAEASASWALVGTGRWSARRKVSVVIEVLKGESLESLSRRHGVTAAKLSQWRDDFVAGGETRLKHREVAVEGRWCTDPAPSVSHDRPPGHRGDSRCMIST